MLGELVRYRHLLYTLVWKDIKIRYKESVMGVLWAVFLPLVIIGSGAVVRYALASAMGRAAASAELLGVSVKAVPWAFFVGAVRFGTQSLLANSNLVTKIYFPRIVFPLSAVIAQFFDFLVASAVLAVILVAMHVGATLQLLWLPVLIGILVVLAMGASIVLSCANLFFRDVKYLVEVLLTFAIFFTPVFYDVAMFGAYAPVLLLNPLAPVLEALNAVVVQHRAPDVPGIAYAAIVAGVTLVGAWRIFAANERRFAEVV